jgi:hypothetical protein
VVSARGQVFDTNFKGDWQVRESCELNLSPLQDSDDFILLRCDANCFHLVLPFLSIHLTWSELSTAKEALKRLWSGEPSAMPSRKQSVLFQAFRCPGGHCHLVCHGIMNICLKEEAAHLLQQEMEAQQFSGGDLKSTPVYLA